MEDPSKTAARLRRAQPRNPDVQAVCDERDRLQDEHAMLKLMEAMEGLFARARAYTEQIRTVLLEARIAAAEPTVESAADCPLCAVRREKQRKRIAAYRAKTKATSKDA